MKPAKDQGQCPPTPANPVRQRHNLGVPTKK
jgi:hypothetical protein